MPEDHELDVSAEGLTDIADIPDFLDMEQQPAPVPARRTEARVVRAPAPAPKEEEQVARKPVRGAAVRGTRVRTPRKEVGFDEETLAMLLELHADGCAQSMEEGLTRSEVARAAIRAIYAARNIIDYSGLGPRGRWGTPTARALLDGLTDSYTRAIGRFYVERYYNDEGGD